MNIASMSYAACCKDKRHCKKKVVLGQWRHLFNFQQKVLIHVFIFKLIIHVLIIKMEVKDEIFT